MFRHRRENVNLFKMSSICKSSVLLVGRDTLRKRNEEVLKVLKGSVWLSWVRSDESRNQLRADRRDGVSGRFVGVSGGFALFGRGVVFALEGGAERGSVFAYTRVIVESLAVRR